MGDGADERTVTLKRSRSTMCDQLNRSRLTDDEARAIIHELLERHGASAIGRVLGMRPPVVMSLALGSAREASRFMARALLIERRAEIIALAEREPRRRSA